MFLRWTIKHCSKKVTTSAATSHFFSFLPFRLIRWAALGLRSQQRTLVSLCSLLTSWNYIPFRKTKIICRTVVTKTILITCCPFFTWGASLWIVIPRIFLIITWDSINVHIAVRPYITLNRAMPPTTKGHYRCSICSNCKRKQRTADN